MPDSDVYIETCTSTFHEVKYNGKSFSAAKAKQLDLYDELPHVYGRVKLAGVPAEQDMPYPPQRFDAVTYPLGQRAAYQPVRAVPFLAAAYTCRTYSPSPRRSDQSGPYRAAIPAIASSQANSE